MSEEETEDQRVFGKGQWIYCSQHLRPHLTGWCTVRCEDKIGLGLSNEEGYEEKAYKKAKSFGLFIREK